MPSMDVRHHPRHRHRRVVLWTLRIAGGLLAILLGIYALVGLRYVGRIQTVEAVEQAPVAMVFGAGLAQQGLPSPMLAARVKVAVDLYRAGKVSRILLTGNSERHHDEIGAMRRAAEGLGLPANVLMLDSGGDSTFDSCLRAREVFGVQKAILVTQRFHMPRALWVANGLGLDAWGVVTNPNADFKLEYAVRELFARPLALVLVLLQPKPAGPDRPL